MDYDGTEQTVKSRRNPVSFRRNLDAPGNRPRPRQGHQRTRYGLQAPATSAATNRPLREHSRSTPGPLPEYSCVDVDVD